MCDQKIFCDKASSGVFLQVGPYAGNSSVDGFTTGSLESGGARFKFEILAEHRESYKNLFEAGKIKLVDGHAVMSWE